MTPQSIVRGVLACLAASLLAPACAPASPQPERAPTAPPTVLVMAPSVPPPPASSAAPAGTGSATTPPPAGRDAWIAGRTITLRGRVSREPWQHMMGHVPGKQPEYFDLEGGSQTVVYTSNPISCAGLVELEGTVVELRGGSKRGGKADETFVEKHLDVTGARCLP